MNRTKLAVCLCLLFSAALAQNAPGADTRSVTVTATGTVYGEPDEAGFDAGVSAVNADVQVATTQVSERVASLMTALKAAGIAAEDVRTSDFSVFPDPRYDNQGQVTEMRYRVSNIVHVTLRDTAQLGALLSKSVALGANEIYNVVYAFSDRTALERQAREEAMTAAREKAEQLARLGGTELGEVRRISEGVSGGVTPFDEVRFTDGTDLAASPEVPVSSGQLSVTVSVQVTFGLE